VERVQQDTERDFFMTPEQAKAYGLIDDIIQAPDKVAVGVGVDGKEAGRG
jgi:ATP-dependent Clp protease protease subunit